jgi:hypothetical protein
MRKQGYLKHVAIDLNWGMWRLSSSELHLHGKRRCAARENCTRYTGRVASYGGMSCTTKSCTRRVSCNNKELTWEGELHDGTATVTVQKSEREVMQKSESETQESVTKTEMKK